MNNNDSILPEGNTERKSYPVSLRGLGSFTLMLMGLLGLFLYGIVERIPDDERPGLDQVLTIAVLTGTMLWFCISALAWYMGSKAGYVWLIGNIILLAAIAIFPVVAISLSEEKDGVVFGVLLFLPFGGLLIYHLVIAFREEVAELRRMVYRDRRSLFVLLTFLVCLVGPVGGVLAWHHWARIEVPVRVYMVNGGFFGAYYAENMVDGDLQTWWTPADRIGDNVTFTVLFHQKEITAVKVHPGSHYLDYPQYGDLFLKNRRLNSAELSFADGSKQTIELADRDEEQVIPLKPVKTNFITVRVLSSKKGTHWQDLCISTFLPMSKEKPFAD